MCKEAVEVAAVPVQKMLDWQLLSSRMRGQLPGQCLCSSHLVLPFVRAKIAVCMRLACTSSPWSVGQNYIYLNYYFGNSANDYSLVKKLHSSSILVNWLSRTIATRIWVANADMKTWGIQGISRAVEKFHSLLCVTGSLAEALGSKQNSWRLPLSARAAILNHETFRVKIERLTDHESENSAVLLSCSGECHCHQ